MDGWISEDELECFSRHRVSLHVRSQNLRITGVTDTPQSVHCSISRRILCDVMIDDNHRVVRRYG